MQKSTEGTAEITERNAGIQKEILMRGNPLRSGKVSPAAVNRSMERPIIMKGAETPGMMTGSMLLDGGTALGISSGALNGPFDRTLPMLLSECMNLAASKRAQTTGILLSVFLPAAEPESTLYALFQDAASFCADYHLRIALCEAKVSDAVIRPVVSAAAYGFPGEEEHNPGMMRIETTDRETPEGLELWMSGFAGAAGAGVLTASFQKEYAQRFSSGFLAETNRQGRCLLLGSDPQHPKGLFDENRCSGLFRKWIRSENILEIRPVLEGGVFAELWNLAEEWNAGLEVDLRSIPIYQETIEICEYAGMNPYQLNSCGAALYVQKNGAETMQEAQSMGIMCARIGTLKAGGKRILRNLEEVRCLEKPAQDELEARKQAGIHFGR